VGIANEPSGILSNITIDTIYVENFSAGVLLNAGAPTVTNASVSNIQTINTTVSATGPVGVEIFYGPAKSGYASFGDADITLTSRTPRVLFQGAGLTANRTVTLDGTGVTPGTEYFIFRQGGGDFTLAVGSLAALYQNESCRVFWDGSAWRLADYRPQSYRTIYQNTRSAAYTLTLSDSGKQIFHPASDNNARTFTIPANSSVNFPIGTEVTFINMVNTVTIAITSDTLTQAGTGSAGSRTLAAYGWARAVKINSTEWLIDGVGLT
jgi:hypothetical protein